MKALTARPWCGSKCTDRYIKPLSLLFLFKDANVLTSVQESNTNIYTNINKKITYIYEEYLKK